MCANLFTPTIRIIAAAILIVLTASGDAYSAGPKIPDNKKLGIFLTKNANKDIVNDIALGANDSFLVSVSNDSVVNGFVGIEDLREVPYSIIDSLEEIETRINPEN